MNTESQPIEPEDDTFAVLKEQRELALACCILSGTLSLAVLWSNLGGEPVAMKDAREAVQTHRKIMQEHQALLATNQKVLADVVAARDALIKVRAGR